MNKHTFRFLTSGMFVLFALVQYNDPDSITWILIYSITAVQPIISWKKFYKKQIDIVLILIFTILILSYIPNLIGWIREGMPSIVSEMKATETYIEHVREALGLLICLVSLIIWRKR